MTSQDVVVLPDVVISQDVVVLPDVVIPLDVPASTCASNRDCAAGVCDRLVMRCVQYLTGAECAGATPAGAWRAGSCVAPPPTCRASRECSIYNKVCDAARSVCVDCVGDVDCTTGQYSAAGNACAPQVCTPGVDQLP